MSVTVVKGFKKLPLLICAVGVYVVGAAALHAETVKKAKLPTVSIIRYDSIHHPIVAEKGMVVSQRQLASDVGSEILEQGGNAVDAAVAVGYALAVLLPRAGNIGGGGFMLIHLKNENKTIAIDYREMAPAAAHRDLYLDADGNVDRSSYRTGIKSVGIPGTVAGFEYVLTQYGTMSREDVMAPAIRLAREGFVMDYDTASAIITREEMLKRDPASSEIFFHPDGSFVRAGETFVQTDLADSLEAISEEGAKAFYTGSIAEKILAKVSSEGGLITAEDLKAYQPVERDAVVGDYRGHKVVSMPPPSSGGVHVIQMLNILENFDIAAMGRGSADSLHVIAESMRYAYADRSKHLGDPGFYDVPLGWLTNKDYAKKIANSIDMGKAKPSSEVAPGEAPKYESRDTTHFSVVDKDGNAVANTYTLNFSFGSGLVVDGAGFILNNEMTDFNAKSGMPDAFGLIGGDANSIQPGKRPLSAMTPTIVFRDGAPFIVTGSPGGSRIINAVLQQLVNVIDHKMNIAEATHAPRIHHQWQPDKLELEASINSDTQKLLDSKGHNTVTSGTMGSLQSILIDNGQLHGASDPRRPGAGISTVD